jgi:uncharacterized protein
MMPVTLERRGEKAPMEYRRFGKTNKALSVVTLGGMRYVDGWSKPREQPHREMVEHAMATISRALSLGINHIETAHGYGKSEYCHGLALSELGVPRKDYFLMTKGDPETADATHRMIEEQLKALKTDHIDLYGWHGINNRERLGLSLAPGGPVDVLRRYQEQGVIGNVGFSTHAPLPVICEAIQSQLFDFVNLHYYYFFQRNWAAVQLAQLEDMGVFIISPNDKGGHLFRPSAVVEKLVRPSSMIAWNARFCLRTPAVHTLSFGMNAPDHFETMMGIFPTAIPLSPSDLKIQHALDERLQVDPISAYEGYEFEGDPSGINIPEVLRFRRLLKCYDMVQFGKYRYNMLEGKGHWFPGLFASEERVARVDESHAPPGVPIKQLLREAHDALYVPKG